MQIREVSKIIFRYFVDAQYVYKMCYMDMNYSGNARFCSHKTSNLV